VVALLGVLGLIGYERRRADPLLELRLFRSVPFTAAILMALFALCGFGAFLFTTTLYLQDARGLSAMAAGLCLLPVGVLVIALSPLAGRRVGGHGPRLPLAVAGAALTLGGVVAMGLEGSTPLAVVVASYLFFGVFLGSVNPPITYTAVAGMPTSMAGLAASLASAGRQTGTTLGIAIVGTILGVAGAGGSDVAEGARGVWWLVVGLGVGLLGLGLLSTSAWARASAERAAALFEDDAPVRTR